MSVRSWISLVTILFIVLMLFFSRHELYHAWRLMEHVDLWILLLIIPTQVVAYLAAGEMMFSYLRSKGVAEHISPLRQAQMALEMNFVNHTLPSAGVSGMSYMTWRLGHFHVSPGRATAAQLVRYVMGFASFIVLLLLALAFITIDGNINRWVLLISGMIVFFMLGGTLMLVYVIGSLGRIKVVGAWLASVVNAFVKMITFGRKRHLVKEAVIIAFLTEMHEEYLTLRGERRLLLKPFLWGLVFNVFDVMVFVIAFWALGHFVSPAPILIAYGLASIAGFIVVTPGGAGAYEAIMVSFLATAGIKPGVAIAGILLARVAVLLGTIVFGYIFYQHTLVTHGKSKRTV